MLFGLLFSLAACEVWRYDFVLERITCIEQITSATFDAPARGMRPVLIYGHEQRALDVELMAADGFES